MLIGTVEKVLFRGSRLDQKGIDLVPIEGLNENLSCRGRHVGFCVELPRKACGLFAIFVQRGSLLPVPVQGWERVGKSASLARYGLQSNMPSQVRSGGMISIF